MRNCLFVLLASGLGIISLRAPSKVRSQSKPESSSSHADAEKSATKTLVNQKLSGTSYTNGASRFTLTVPEGWKANDNLVDPTIGIGALTAPDGEANLVIQLKLTSDSPKALAKKIEAQGNSLFPGYHKVSESKLSVGGKDCEALTLKYTQHRTVNGVAVEVPMAAKLVLMPKEYGFLVFEFVTLESIFDQRLPTFDKIMSSFRSTEAEGVSRKPK